MTATRTDATLPADRRLIDANALAQRLGVTTRFVRRLVEERRITYLKIGRLVRFDPAEVDRWIEEQRVEPPRPLSARRGTRW